MQWFLILFLISSSLFAAPFKVGLLLDKSGKDDKSFNASAYAGIERAKKELGIEFRMLDAKDETAAKSILREFVRAKYNLIIAIGFAQQSAVTEVAGKSKEASFAIVDAEVKLPNVKSILFSEQEGSFLVGAIAALTSKTDKFGFVGGMDIPLIRRFLVGYEAGVKHINPKAKVIVNYIGVTNDSWRNPGKAKDLALKQYSEGAEVVFHAAGASGSGVFDAAEQKKKFAIGVDSNQNWMKPKHILTSMLKRVDSAVFDTIREAKNNQFKSGLFVRGVKDQGVDFALDENNKDLISPDTLKKVDAIKNEIASGKIKISESKPQKK